MKDLIIQFIKDYYPLILTIAYELLVRIAKTKNNWSLIHLAVRIVDFLIKNKSKEGEFRILKDEE